MVRSRRRAGFLALVIATNGCGRVVDAAGEAREPTDAVAPTLEAEALDSEAARPDATVPEDGTVVGDADAIDSELTDGGGTAVGDADATDSGLTDGDGEASSSSACAADAVSAADAPDAPALGTVVIADFPPYAIEATSAGAETTDGGVVGAKYAVIAHLAGFKWYRRVDVYFAETPKSGVYSVASSASKPSTVVILVHAAGEGWFTDWGLPTACAVEVVVDSSRVTVRIDPVVFGAPGGRTVAGLFSASL